MKVETIPQLFEYSIAVWWTRRAIDHESDHRHAEKLIEELWVGRCRKVVTPVVRESRMARETEGAQQKLEVTGVGDHR